MKQILLLLTVLLFAAHSGFAQSKQRVRSPYFHNTAAAHPSNGDRGNAPANDDCGNALSIVVLADCATPINGDNSAATNDGPDASCDDPGADLRDVWYTFNSGAEDTVAISLVPGPGMTDFAFVLYDGCGGNEVFCQVLPPGPMNVPVSPGTDYVLRVHSNPFYGDPGPFTICVTLPVAVAPPPPNDLCSAVSPAPLTVGNSVTFMGDNTGATDTEGFGTGSAWEAFTLSTCADVKISYCGTTPAWSGLWTVLYDGCPPLTGVYVGSYDSTACGDQNFTMCFPNLAAGTYYYPVVQGITALGQYTLVVSAEPCGTVQATNDECAGAIPIVAHATCQPETFTNPCASQSLPGVTCGAFTGNANDDVWYSFVATATDMTIGGAPVGSMDIVMELFSGTCGALTSIGCGDVGGAGVADDLIASGLTVGDTYYFRVYDFSWRYAYEAPGYELCVVEGLGSGVGMPERTAEVNGGVYPNPSNGTFTIRANSGATITAVQVIDAAGRTVLRGTPNKDRGAVHVDASALTPGTYVLRYTEDGALKNERLIIQ